MSSVLMVLTGAKTWTMKDGTPHPTGFWAEEFIKPHRAFTEAGLEVSIATPRGVTPTADPLSLADAYYKPEEISEQKAYLEAQADALGNTLVLEDVDPVNYDAMFVVGGHGPMQDLAVHPSIGDLFAAMLDDPNKTVASVCHGPASFLSAHSADGTWLFRDREVTSFTNEEETQATFAGNAPWLLEDRLRLAGARFNAESAWDIHVVVDGNLITGQNQNSAEAAAKAVLERLRSAVGVTA
jgi:putative intracellular protease/amidase